MKRTLQIAIKIAWESLDSRASRDRLVASKK